MLPATLLSWFFSPVRQSYSVSLSICIFHWLEKAVISILCPSITFTIHIHHIPQDNSAPSGTVYINPCPGLVVDAYGGKDSISSATTVEFYLNSHTAIQGITHTSTLLMLCCTHTDCSCSFLRCYLSSFHNICFLLFARVTLRHADRSLSFFLLLLLLHPSSFHQGICAI